MKCPKCKVFIIFGNLSLDENDNSRLYICCNCGFSSTKVKDFWSKKKEEIWQKST